MALPGVLLAIKFFILSSVAVSSFRSQSAFISSISVTCPGWPWISVEVFVCGYGYAGPPWLIFDFLIFPLLTLLLCVEGFAFGCCLPRCAIQDRPVLAEQLPSITVPTLVISGGNSQAKMGSAAQTLADALLTAQHRSLEGQTHDIVPAVLAPVLEEFFAS